MTATKQTTTNVFSFNVSNQANDTSIGRLTDQIDVSIIRCVVLDFSQTLSIDKSFYQAMYRLKRELSIKNIDLKSININPKLKQQIIDHGTESFFNIEKKAQGKGINVKFIQPFINATINVLQVQTQADCKMLTPTTKSKFSPQYDVEIAGVLSLVSNTFMGSVGICYPKDTFLKISEKLFGQEYTEIDAEIEDAASEILNMIFGGAKAELNKEFDYGIQKALPTVIRADSLKLRQYSSDSTLVLPFESTIGDFHIEIEAVQQPKA